MIAIKAVASGVPEEKALVMVSIMKRTYNILKYIIKLQLKLCVTDLRCYFTFKYAMLPKSSLNILEETVNNMIKSMCHTFKKY